MPIRITARTAGFRRLGRAWPEAPVVLADDALSAEERAALKAEPDLVVEDLDEPPKKGGAKKTAAPSAGEGA